MTDFYTAISNFGFPIVVAAYLLFRFENKIEKLNESINKLVQEFEKLNERRRS